MYSLEARLEDRLTAQKELLVLVHDEMMEHMASDVTIAKVAYLRDELEFLEECLRRCVYERN